MEKISAADKSINAYDQYVFSCVGRSFDANKADALAAIASIDCEAAAKNKAVNQFTRNIYKAKAEEFKRIAA
jgi:hypothetical protein